MKKARLYSDLIKNWHYVLGLALQRGMPFITIPLVTHYFSRLVYANYVLLFSLVQFLALVIGLGAAGAAIVFWHKYENKDRYVSQFFLLLILLHLVAFVLLLPLIIIYLPRIITTDITALVVLTALYVLSYNASAVSASILRAKMLPRLYFWSVFWSSLILVALIYILGKFTANLLGLVVVFILTNFFQASIFLFFSKLRLKFRTIFTGFYLFAKEVLGYSVPLMLYTLLTLSLVTVDKWLVKLYLPQLFFTNYVYNFQFAYVVNLISIVLNMYTVPLFCTLINEENYLSVKSKLKDNYILSVASSICLSFAAYFYAALTNIPLTKGFWIFSLAFLFCNIFAINVSFMEAARSAKNLFYISLLPTFLFWLFFIISLKFLPHFMIYFSFIVYYVILIIFSRRFISAWFKKRCVV